MQQAPPPKTDWSGAEARKSKSGFRRQAPVNPENVMVFREIAPAISTCCTPFLHKGVLKIGARCTVVRLSTGSIAVISPVAPTPGVQDMIRGMKGRVGYIVVLNLDHHLYLDRWKTLYPAAQVVAPVGLAAKRDQKPNTSSVPIAHTITPAVNQSVWTVSQEFDENFELAYFQRGSHQEIVVFDKPSRSLIEADLMFNLPAVEQYSKAEFRDKIGVSKKLVGSAMGYSGLWGWKERVSKRITGHKKALREFRQALTVVDGWDFNRIIPCHGDIIDITGKEAFRKEFKKFLPPEEPHPGSRVH